MTVLIAPNCTACGACIATCPTRFLTPARHHPAVDDDLCTDCLACLEVCPVDAIRSPEDTVHPIELESYRLLNERVDLRCWPEDQRQVVARMVHATADESFANSARIGADAVPGAVAALRAGVVIVCDARMVIAGMPSVPRAVCLLDEVADTRSADTRSADTRSADTRSADTRSAAAIRLAPVTLPVLSG